MSSPVQEMKCLKQQRMKIRITVSAPKKKMNKIVIVMEHSYDAFISTRGA